MGDTATMSTNKKLIFKQIIFVASNEAKSFYTVPFPIGIELILVTYIKMAYYTFLIPYKLELNNLTKSYTIQSGMFRKVVSRSLVSLAFLQFLVKVIPSSKVSFPTMKSLGILFLFGWLGRASAILSYIVVLNQHKNAIMQLINSLKRDSAGQDGHFFPSLDQNLKNKHRRKYQFVTKLSCCIVTVLPFATFNSKVFSQHSPIVKMISDSFPGFQDTVKSSSLLRVAFKSVQIFEYASGMYNEILYYYFLLLGTLTALMMLLICNKFVGSLFTSGPSQLLTDETKIFSAFMKIRKTFKSVNTIFGPCILFIFIGEFPNNMLFLLFCFIFTYTKSTLVTYALTGVFQITILLLSTRILAQLQKARNWIIMNGDWSSNKKLGLKRAGLVYELNSDVIAISGYGFFKISYSFLFSILGALLSYALIVLQLTPEY